MSVGLALIFGIMKVVNFAQGDFMMLGVFVTYFLFAFLGIHPLLGALLTIPPLYLLGVLVHRSLMVHVSGGGTTQEMDAQLILTLAGGGWRRGPKLKGSSKGDPARQLMQAARVPPAQRSCGPPGGCVPSPPPAGEKSR